MAFSKWDPLHDLIALHERLNRLGPVDAPGWSPAIDVYETATAFVVSAELPGLSREHISIDMQHQTLTLRGVRPHAERPEARFHRVERGHGAFRRSFVLPGDVEASAITAECHDGVLTVVVPKSPSTQRRIEIQ